MSGEDDLGPLVDEELKGGKGFTNTGDIVDHHRAVLFLHWHVVIDPDEHPFTGNLKIMNKKLGHNPVWDLRLSGAPRQSKVIFQEHG